MHVASVAQEGLIRVWPEEKASDGHLSSLRGEGLGEGVPSAVAIPSQPLPARGSGTPLRTLGTSLGLMLPEWLPSGSCRIAAGSPAQVRSTCPMKLIIAIIKPFKLDAVRDALTASACRA